MKKKITTLITIFLTAALFCSCASKKWLEVGDSQLNWLQIRYTPTAHDPVYINIIGTGAFEYVTGKSPLVLNAFAQNVTDPNWNDIRTEHLGRSPQEAQNVMQQFVDAGMLSAKLSPKNTKKDAVLLRWKFGFKENGCLTDDRKIIDLVEALMGILE